MNLALKQIKVGTKPYSPIKKKSMLNYNFVSISYLIYLTNIVFTVNNAVNLVKALILGESDYISI